MFITKPAVCKVYAAGYDLLISLDHQTSLLTTPNNVLEDSMQARHSGAFMGVFLPEKMGGAPAKTRKPKDPDAPKRPRGRPRKDASQASAKQDNDLSMSDSESDELQVEEMPEPTPDLLRGPKPEIAEYQIIYDVAVAVWSPRNKPALAEKVRKGITLFGDVVKQQRDAWKVKNEALKQAELANTTAIPSLKQEVAQFRKMIETMAVQALRFGHPAHLAKYVYPCSRPFLPSPCPVVECDYAMLNPKGYVSFHISSAERNRSMLLHPLQSHNKGLDNGYGQNYLC